MPEFLHHTNLKDLWQHHESYLAALIVLLIVALGLGTEDFMTLGNIFDMTVSSAILGIMACGLFVVLIAGGSIYPSLPRRPSPSI